MCRRHPVLSPAMGEGPSSKSASAKRAYNEPVYSENLTSSTSGAPRIIAFSCPLALHFPTACREYCGRCAISSVFQDHR